MDSIDVSFDKIENEGLRARVKLLEEENSYLEREVQHMYRIFDLQDIDFIRKQRRLEHLGRALCLAAKILAGTVMCPKRSQQLCADLDCPEGEPPVRCWQKVIEESIQNTGVLARKWRDLLEEVTDEQG